MNAVCGIYLICADSVAKNLSIHDLAIINRLDVCFYECVKQVLSYLLICRSIFGSDGNGIVVKRLNSDESSSDSDSESVASSSGRSNSDIPAAKVARLSDGQKPTNVLIEVCCV